MCVCVCVQVEWEEVKLEMVEEKGLPSDVADRIGEYVQLSGKSDLLDKLISDAKLMAVKDAVVGLEEMKLLLKYCELFGVLDKVWEVGGGGGRGGGEEGRRGGGGGGGVGGGGGKE